MVGALQRRSAVRHVQRCYSVSERRGCEVTGMHRSTCRYASVRPSQAALRQKIRDECLNVHWFDDLTDAQTKLQAWRQEYNET